MKFILYFLAIIGCTSAQFSATAQAAIVKAHNDLRSEIAQGAFIANNRYTGAATNMLKMKWDSTIAASAQKFASTCSNGKSGTPNVGENLYITWSSTAPSSLDKLATTATNTWAQEFQDIGLDGTYFDQKAMNSGISRATQMVWAKTNLVGCGVANCGKDASKGNLIKVVVVCQYKPPGNVLNTDIYKYDNGSSCSQCPSGTKCDDDSKLCV